ncbi:replication initiation protein [Hymenobacter sp. AT01-02]|uniref:replication initiation protein n=1 Tax=Hymenobacter sp. AT01-02 TaxID=1571877 RepID=UPI000AD00025|nr:replication initiation protein [Hymenobacter sp. AT01-02]
MMKKDIEIRQHNALTNARYDYTEMQLDLLFFLVSKLRKDQKTAVYELSIKELSTLTGKKYDYPYLRKATEGMGSRVFEVETATQHSQLWMFQRVNYLKGQGIIEIKLTEDIVPYLFDLKDNFTSYELASALRLTSKYAKRIYQICSQWKDLGETKKYDLEDFRKMLGLIDDKGNEKMKQVKELREKVLDIAVKQINEHTELQVSYKLEKRVRTFKNIVFTVKPQALADTIPFDLVQATTTAAPAGLAPHQVENAGRLLDQVGIKTPALVATILGNAAHVAVCNKFAHDMKTGKHAKTHSLSGLLLTVLGLKKPATGPLFSTVTE